MIQPAKLDLVIYQGATFYKKFTWKDNRTPIDITGYKFRMQIRTSTSSDVVLADFSSSNGDFYLEDPANGVFVLEIPHTVTADYEFDKAIYDIECEFPDARVFRILYGSVSVSKEVTR